MRVNGVAAVQRGCPVRAKREEGRNLEEKALLTQTLTLTLNIHSIKGQNHSRDLCSFRPRMRGFIVASENQVCLHIKSQNRSRYLLPRGREDLSLRRFRPLRTKHVRKREPTRGRERQDPRSARGLDGFWTGFK